MNETVDSGVGLEKAQSPEQLVEIWVKRISESGVVEEFDPAVLRQVLIEHGANFNLGETLAPLAEYSNKSKASAMRGVWAEKYDEFKIWAEEWTSEFELKEGNIKLPRLETSGSKISGCLQFFGELTAYAAGKLTFTDFKQYIEARVLNGKLWQEGKGEERVKIKLPGGKEIRPSSFPPDFPKAAWDKIKGI